MNNNFENNSDNINNIKKELLSLGKKNEESIEQDCDCYLYFFSIILNDYENHPNHKLNETIKSVENFATYYFGKNNRINLKYKILKDIENDKKIELFGDFFVNNNKENCFLVINGNVQELSRYIHLTKIIDDSNISTRNEIILEITMIEKSEKRITDMSFMFYKNSSLLDADFSNFDMEHIINVNSMFYNCSSFTKLPDISDWNTINIENMSYLFYKCSSLLELPDISKWKTDKVNNISYMFSRCSSLKTIPDISSWNTSNVKYMNNLFWKCSSLISLPDISIWNTKRVTNISYMFSGCLSLSSIPDISKWSINAISNVSYLLQNCRSLTTLPNIQNWQKFNDIYGKDNMFEGTNLDLPVFNIMPLNNEIEGKHRKCLDCCSSLKAFICSCYSKAWNICLYIVFLFSILLLLLAHFILRFTITKNTFSINSINVTYSNYNKSSKEKEFDDETDYNISSIEDKFNDDDYIFNISNIEDEIDDDIDNTNGIDEEYVIIQFPKFDKYILVTLNVILSFNYCAELLISIIQKLLKVFKEKNFLIIVCCLLFISLIICIIDFIKFIVTINTLQTNNEILSKYSSLDWSQIINNLPFCFFDLMITFTFFIWFSCFLCDKYGFNTPNSQLLVTLIDKTITFGNE